MPSLRLVLSSALLLVVCATGLRAEEGSAGRKGLIGPIQGSGHVDVPADADTCGVDTLALAARCAAALKAHPGKVHHVVPVTLPGRPPHPAIAGEAVARLRAGADVAEIARRTGLALGRVIPEIGVAVFRREGGDALEVVGRLAADPGVSAASPAWVARCSLTPNDDLFPVQLGARGMDVEGAWDLSRGAGVTVAVIDTGIDAGHPDLQGALAPNGWVDVVNGAAAPFDDNGHGTAMAGIIASRFQNAIGTAGVAPEAQILAVKVADRNGVASVADVAAGIVEAVRRGAGILNLSLGAYVDDAALRLAVEYAVNAGALVIAAAGNENVNAPTWPAACAGVLAVGGSGSRPAGPGGVPAGGATPPPEIAFSTALAPSLALLAPSEKVVAPLPGGVFGYVNGTSAASAHAAGVAALVKAHAPGLGAAQIAQVLRQAVDPIPALAAASEVFPFGRLSARKALDRDAASYADAGVTGFTLQPLAPVAGRDAKVRARFQNQGNAPIARLVVKAQYYVPGNPIAREIAPLVLSAIAAGEVRTVDFAWPAIRLPAAGTYDVEVVATALQGETEVADNAVRRTIQVGTAPEADVQVATLLVEPDFRSATPGVAVAATIRNLGGAPETDVDVAFAANGVVFRTIRVASLPVLADQALKVHWPFPAAPPERVAFDVTVAARTGETRLDDNGAGAQVRVGVASARPVEVLYQQGNDVDLISDAPFRVAGGRPYVPLLLFAPSKGDPDPDTYLTFRDVQVHAKDDATPGSPGTLIYRDASSGAPQAAMAGLETLDEMGAVQPTLDVFQDQELRRNGRHMLLRVPRAAWSLPSLPAQKFLDVRMDWSFHRRILWLWDTTRTGSNKKVMRFTFADAPLPSLPGENHYYDIHFHTIAEWFFESWIQVFAPRKAYGGPIVMACESAYSVGMIDSPTNVLGLLTTTDHNAFYNETVGNPNDPDRRPPFGPTSPAASTQPGGAITTEHARYREIFGVAAGEEVAVEAQQTFSYLGVGLSLPLGAHMVSYRGEHVEGPWHGGGWIPDPSSPNITMPYDSIAKIWSQANQPVNGESFVYAAHPFSDMLGWSDAQRRLALGLDPQYRTLDHVHASPPGFLFKGFQLWNGRGGRSLPSSVIDFDDLNPWIDASWLAGDPRWDGKLTDGLSYWHEAISQLLSYAFTSDPDGVFVRKVFIGAGSDAHGDFNYSISRLASPLTLQATYGVGLDPYAGARTYVFADGFPGASPGERFMRALSAGRSIATDGPVLSFTMDAEGRFDAQNLVWHDASNVAEDDDGLMGGGGALDGRGSMLVATSGPAVWFRYAWQNASDFGGGPVAAIKIYKDAPGAPNPSRRRAGHDEPIGVGGLAVPAAGALASERLDPSEEGLVTAPSAYALAAFTGGDPDVAPIGIDDYRCYTNPVWTLPVTVGVAAPHASPTEIGVGELTVQLDFPISMDPTSTGVELKALDVSGSTSNRTVTGVPLTGTYGSAGGARAARLTLTNPVAIPLTGEAYPAAGTKTFAVYFRDPPRDMNGNELNRFAFAFSTAAPSAVTSTASPSTTGSAPRAGGSGGGGGGGCAAAIPETGFDSAEAAAGSLAPYLMLLAVILALRFRTRTT